MIEHIDTLVEPKQRSQQEFDEEYYGIIARLLDINIEIYMLAHALEERPFTPSIFETDLQAEKLAELTEERDRLLVEVLQEPAVAFAKEFELLGRLYEGRTLTETDSMGTTVSHFVTRDPSRQKADLHFRHIEYESGTTEQIVEVPGKDSEEAPYFISLKNNELRLATTVYHRGMNQRVEVDAASSQGARMLVNFFSHSVTASGLMYNRLPDEITEADAQALEFLKAK